jgi:hypothetical protein
MERPGAQTPALGVFSVLPQPFTPATTENAARITKSAGTRRER